LNIIPLIQLLHFLFKFTPFDCLCLARGRISIEGIFLAEKLALKEAKSNFLTKKPAFQFKKYFFSAHTFLLEFGSWAADRMNFKETPAKCRLF
jgi:hypothetical protein